jgi:hypothetical protein
MYVSKIYLHYLCLTQFRDVYTIYTRMLALEFLRPTVSRPVRLGIGPPFGTLDQILSCSPFFVWQLLYFSFEGAFSICSLQCNHSMVRLLTPSNHTLPSHLRLCSLFVASYDSQGLRWRYSNPHPHGVYKNVELSWVHLTADSQSTSSSWYRAPLWDPWPHFILSFL